MTQEFEKQVQFEFEELSNRETQLKHDLETVQKKKKPLKEYLSSVGVIETEKKKGRPKQ